jgi:tetratricopeptide (TPR) repeat protein
MTVDEYNTLLQQGVEDYNEKRYVEASIKFKTLRDVNPDNVVMWHNYGLCLVNLNRFDEAIEILNVPCNANYGESMLSKGAALRSLGRYEEAMVEFFKCMQVEPNNPKAYSNYGNSCREFGMPELAIAYLNKALEMDPNDPTFKLNHSVANLLKGDLINGWKNYDGRWFYESDASFKPQLPGTEFNGTQDVNGKIICVYCEQGFGDSIQFIRFVKLLQNKGARILLVTRPELVTLFQYNFPEIEIRSNYDNLAYHHHVALMDLPKCFNTTIDTIPNPDPYLSVSNDVVDKYTQLLGPKTKTRIGIVWSSNSIAFTTRFRQVNLEQLLKTFVDLDVELVNVKYDTTQEEIDLLNQYNVKIVPQSNFEDLAGIIKNLDLLVSVDTVHAHLAGSMGIQTYVMLADYGMDWRWFLHRKDSPFYNCVKLFRQHGDSDWLSVFIDIQNEIKSVT